MLDENRFSKQMLQEVDDDAKEATSDDTPINEFDGLDLRYALCFGYSSPKANSWTNIAEIAIDKGWNNIDASMLEENFMHNIEACYYNIAQFMLENVEDDMCYNLMFDNSKSLWHVSIKNSPKAEMTVEQRADFFKSDVFQKIAKQTYYIIINAIKIYKKIVKQHIENGELINIDIIKLDAILHYVDQEYFLENLVNGKYLNY